MENYKIEKCNILKAWLVFEKHGNLYFEVFRAKTKKECKQWLSSK